MFKFSKNQKLPEGRWISVTQVGVGDGRGREFPLAAGFEKAILFVRSYRTNKTYRREAGDVHFRAAVTVPDGGAPVATFDEGSAPDAGAAIMAVLLDDERSGDASASFCILPMTMGASEELKDLSDKQKKDRKLKELDGLSLYRLAFRFLVTGWSGVADKDGVVHECSDETKDKFLDLFDAGIFGSIVMEAAQDLQQLMRREEKAEEGN